MGTRNLTIVYSNGEYKVAQYGQWDGYPEGLGVQLLKYLREYLRNKRNLSPPDVINLIEKHVLPVRPGRKDPRKVKPQASVSFLYRVA